MLRTLEIGYHKGIKSYASEDRTVKEATAIAERCKGMVNVRIVPVNPKPDSMRVVLRFTAVFYCFSDENDMMYVAGTGFMVHR